MKQYYVSVWRKELAERLGEVLMCSPAVPGGRRADESVEEYVERGRAIQDEALMKYRVALRELAWAETEDF